MHLSSHICFVDYDELGVSYFVSFKYRSFKIIGYSSLHKISLWFKITATDTYEPWDDDVTGDVRNKANLCLYGAPYELKILI